jgi:hypothetical protein
MTQPIPSTASHVVVVNIDAFNSAVDDIKILVEFILNFPIIFINNFLY